MRANPGHYFVFSHHRWSLVEVAVPFLESDASEEEITAAQALLTSSRAANIYYNASQSSGVGIYPAGRFNPNTRGRFVLSDNGGQTSHGVLTVRGLALGTRLVTGLFHS